MEFTHPNQECLSKKFQPFAQLDGITATHLAIQPGDPDHGTGSSIHWLHWSSNPEKPKFGGWPCTSTLHRCDWISFPEIWPYDIQIGLYTQPMLALVKWYVRLLQRQRALVQHDHTLDYWRALCPIDVGSFPDSNVQKHLVCNHFFALCKLLNPGPVMLHSKACGLVRRTAGSGRQGCKNIRLGGDSVETSCPRGGAHMCYVVYRSFKFKPSWSISGLLVQSQTLQRGMFLPIQNKTWIGLAMWCLYVYFYGTWSKVCVLCARTKG